MERLESRGVKCWVAPRNIRAGANYSAEIVTGIQSSASLIVLISKDSLASRHVEREVNIADGLRKSIYPVKLIDIEIYGGLSFYLSVSQEVRLFEKTGDPVEKLIASIKAVSGSKEQVPPEVDTEPAVPVDQATSGSRHAYEIPDEADKPDRPVVRDSREYGRDNNQSAVTEPKKYLLQIASVSVLSLAAVLYLWNSGGSDSEVTSSASPESGEPEILTDVETVESRSSPSPVVVDKTNSAETTDASDEAVKPGCSNETGTEPAMVVLPSGQFVMGSDATNSQNDERPVHTVTISYPFALSRCEISVAEFAAFIDDTGYRTSAEESGGCWVYDPAADSGVGQKANTNWRSPGFTQQAAHPAVCISWDDAIAYIEWLNRKTGSSFRLPSEAELEYAIRGGTQEDFPWGQASQCDYSNGADQSMPPELLQIFNSKNWTLADCEDGYGYTAPVASYPVNPFGLYDVSGNAWEWTQDCWNESYVGAPSDGSAWAVSYTHLTLPTILLV